MELIPSIELVKSVLSKKEAQKGLVKLYADSQSECTRNGACGMEIGMSREKDLGAVLKFYLGDSINLEIDNAKTQDYEILTDKFSSKHSQGRFGCPVKAKWTSADTSVQDAIKYMIDAPDIYYPHLLITYIDLEKKLVTFLCITSTNNRDVIKRLGDKAFKVPNGNSRGIEYSTAAMKELLKNPYFKITISDADVAGGIDPIHRRMNILRDIKP
jgi:hypothetical protein